MKPQKVSKNGLSAKGFFAAQAFALQSAKKTRAGTALDPRLFPAHISRSVRPLPPLKACFFLTAFGRSLFADGGEPKCFSLLRYLR
ncbi:hypothetical protein BEL04_16370 [Mucilaginibacter sp. PPCGB 2223]|nr:hypothetical protein BEL04_16370 [Mucilaginibacter sp. PPCGB 2223]